MPSKDYLYPNCILALPLFAMWSNMNHFTSWGLSFLIYKMGLESQLL